MSGVLVAGVGNLFLGDDGFGPAVARLLAGGPALPPGVRVTDYGIRGLHLAHDLLAGFDTLILLDALPADGEPSGRVVVLRVDSPDEPHGTFDAHGMNPVAVLAAVERLGGTVPPTFVVGCRVTDTGERIGLSPAVAAAVPEAAETVRVLLGRLTSVRPGRS
ncbi:hydrogenase maturation protease [Actinoplanes sp. NPDC051861]|uniref:hydrogenase maturation protease n=1 Tax=Actinoplanes sp. NPDC051861 TaxID=3155170 RepID=UPI00343BA99C